MTAPTGLPRRRRRHGRGIRGPLAWPPVPAMTSRAERFDDLVLEVEEVPPSDPAPWEHAEIPLGRVFAAQGRTPARVVIYRRPIHTRAGDDRDLALLVEHVVTEQIAGLLGVEPHDLDPRYEQD